MIRWSEASAPTLRALAARGAVALWPTGSTEQHGAHLATGFDLASATAVCERAVTEASTVEVVLLPGLAFGASDHWLALGATLSLRASTLELVLQDIVRSCERAGFERLVIVNGHAGNVGPVTAALGSEAIAMRVELVSYWMLVDATELAAACKSDHGGIGHAGEVETSIGLFLGEPWIASPALPSVAGAVLSAGMPGSRSRAVVRSPRPLTESPSGVYGDPRQARQDLGALVVERAANALAQLLET